MCDAGQHIELPCCCMLLHVWVMLLHVRLILLLMLYACSSWLHSLIVNLVLSDTR